MKRNLPQATDWLLLIVLLAIAFYLYPDVISRDMIINSIIKIYYVLVNKINYYNEATLPVEVYLPLAFTVIVALIVFLFRDPMPRPIRFALIVCTFLMHTVYIVFRLGTFNLHDPASTVASVALYATEFMHYLMMCCFYLQMAWTIDRTQQANEFERLVTNADYLPRVAFFIPTYDEGEELLRRTIVGAQAVEYPHKTVYLLDDGTHLDEQEPPRDMAKLAKELGCEYIARSDNKGAKAGNLNNALSQTDEDLIAFLDCDNIPSVHFLKRMVGFFSDPEIAMVISSLHYYNAQTSTGNVGIEMLVASDHARSLGMSQTGRDAFNALLCFGTSYIVRRDALERIEGIPTETLCEDWATSIRLQAHGYKTYFLDEVLSSGMAAECVSEFVQQRLRWCQGTVQSIYTKLSNPLRISGLNIVQRIVHLFGVLYYFMFVANVVAFAIPPLYFIFGIVPIQANLTQFIVFFVPFFLIYNVMYLALSRSFSSLVSSQISDYLLTFPLAAVVITTLIDPSKRIFRVTNKNMTIAENSIVPWLGLPLFCMFMIYLGGILIGFGNVTWLGVDGPLGAYIGWCIYRMVLFWMAFQAATNLQQRRQGIRFGLTTICQLSDGNGVTLGEGSVSDISEYGVQLITDVELPSRVILSFPGFGLKNVSACVARRVGEDRYGLSFVGLNKVQRRHLIAFLYTTKGRWSSRGRSELTTFRAIGRYILGFIN